MHAFQVALQLRRQPKYGSERTVTIPEQLVQMLAMHVQNIGVHGEQQWLFIGDNGNPPHQNTSGYWWRKTVKAAGLEAVSSMTCGISTHLVLLLPAATS